MTERDKRRGVRWWLRRNLPEPMRRRIAILRRSIMDRALGPGAIVTSAGLRADQTFIARIHASQPIRQTQHAVGKIENLRLAAQRLAGVVIQPGQIFSFWALVGAPTSDNGFQVGRSIVQDQLIAEVGGGLCQISGLVYELALRGGLSIIERFPHSRDLYSEETRFTPLGLDATIVHGFTDLRISNDGAVSIAFSFSVKDDEIRGALLSPAPIDEWRVEISREDDSIARRHARVCRIDPTGRTQEVSSTHYVVDIA